MEKLSHEGSLVSEKKTSTQVEIYRWVIVTIFAMFCAINFFQVLQFTIIANITSRYYNVSRTMVYSTALIFAACYIILFIPVGHIIGKYNLRTIAVIVTALTAAGNLVKLFAASPDRFYLIMISQLLCAIAHVFLRNIPTKVACVWFGAEEVSTACAIGIMGSAIGIAIGCVIPSFLVQDSFNVNDVSKGFFTLFVIDNVASISIFLVVVLFFRSSPFYPPSHSQAMIRMQENYGQMNYINSFTEILKCKDYILILFSCGIPYGVGHAIGILINEIFLHFFPGHLRNAGLLAFLSVVAGGICGTLIIGKILDKTHEFKVITLFTLTLNCLAWVLQAMAFYERSLVGVFIFFTINGFFNGSLLMIGFEYAMEKTYPTPESYALSLLNVTIYLVTIIYIIILKHVFETFGYTSGQLVIGLSFAIPTFGILSVSSDLKRREANLLSPDALNYGTLSKKQMENDIEQKRKD